MIQVNICNHSGTLILFPSLIKKNKRNADRYSTHIYNYWKHLQKYLKHVSTRPLCFSDRFFKNEKGLCILNYPSKIYSDDVVWIGTDNQQMIYWWCKRHIRFTETIYIVRHLIRDMPCLSTCIIRLATIYPPLQVMFSVEYNRLGFMHNCQNMVREQSTQDFDYSASSIVQNKR